jgi:hypothetical protein
MPAELSGPFFAADVDVVVAQHVRAIAGSIAVEAEKRVKILMRAFFKRPRPFYWTIVHARSRADYWVVTDGAFTPYGHWLAGTGSRNKSTRFKGYQHWTLTVRSLHNVGTLERVTTPAVNALVKRLNG